MASAVASGFVVSNWRPFPKNTLVGFLSLTTPSGMVINKCAFHRKPDSSWVSLPSEKYEKDGQTAYKPLVEFASKEAKQRFQEQAIAAVERYLRTSGEGLR